MARGKWLGLLGVALTSAFSMPALAQMRGQVPKSRRIRPRVDHRGHAKPPATAHRGWTAAHASFVVSAESLFGIGYSREVQQQTVLGETREAVESGATFHVFKGSEIASPFSTSRLAFDAVLGPGVTLGAGFGVAYTNLELNDAGRTETTRLRTLVFTPRIGYLLAPSRYLGVWLRGGVGYVNMKISAADDSGNDDKTTLSTFAVVIDPMLVVTPLPHVGILVGPSLNVGAAGSASTRSAGSDEIEHDNRFSYYGVSAGIALLF